MYRETRFVTNYRRPPPFPRLFKLVFKYHESSRWPLLFSKFFFRNWFILPFRYRSSLFNALTIDANAQNIFLIILSHQYRSHTSSFQFFHLSILFDSDSTRRRKIRELTRFQEGEGDGRAFIENKKDSSTLLLAFFLQLPFSSIISKTDSATRDHRARSRIPFCPASLIKNSHGSSGNFNQSATRGIFLRGSRRQLCSIIM